MAMLAPCPALCQASRFLEVGVERWSMEGFYQAGSRTGFSVGVGSQGADGIGMVSLGFVPKGGKEVSWTRLLFEAGPRVLVGEVTHLGLRASVGGLSMRNGDLGSCNPEIGCMCEPAGPYPREGWAFLVGGAITGGIAISPRPRSERRVRLDPAHQGCQ